MLEISKKLFDEWNNNSIRYCHWKSNEHLIQGLDGNTDVDVLVSINDKDKCEKLLKKLKLKKFKPQKGSRYENIDEWIGFDAVTGKIIHIHLHYRLITGKEHVKEYILPWSEIALNTRVMEKNTGVYIISPNLEIITLYTRIILKTLYGRKVIISDEDKKEIDFLKIRINVEEVKTLCLLIYKNCGLDLFNLIQLNDVLYNDLRKLKKDIKKELKYYKSYAELISFALHYYHIVSCIFRNVANSKLSATYILKKTSSDVGFSVCFIGADGSGKSILSDHISEWLSWKIDCRKFYLGSGDHYNSIFKAIIKVTKKSQESSKLIFKIKQIIYKSKNVRLMKIIISIIHSLELIKISKRALKTLKRADGYQKKGGIAIFDRLPQIQFAGIYDGPKIRTIYGKAFNNRIFGFLADIEENNLKRAVTYSPKIIFKLVLPPEVAIIRKPDHNFKEILIKTDITKKLSFIHSKVYNINASQNYDNEVLEVKNIIWNQICHQ